MAGDVLNIPLFMADYTDKLIEVAALICSIGIS